MRIQFEQNVSQYNTSQSKRFIPEYKYNNYMIKEKKITQ